MTIRFTDGNGFGHRARDADLAVIVIERADIEALRVGRTVGQLMRFSDDAQPVHQFAARMLLHVSGYDDDPRPLEQIDECVRFFRALDMQWNYWLHFLQPDSGQLKMIVLMLVDKQVLSTNPDGAGSYALRQPVQLGHVLRRLLRSMAVLHSTFDVPRSHARAVTQAIAGMFESG